MVVNLEARAIPLLLHHGCKYGRDTGHMIATTTLFKDKSDHIIRSSDHVNYHAFSTEIDETSDTVQIIAVV